jgi:histidinol-phosphatase
MGLVETDLVLARRAALAGAAVGMRHFAALADLPRESKADGSIVTEADRAVEAAIREVLTAARPHDAILGEEGGLTAGTIAGYPAAGEKAIGAAVRGSGVGGRGAGSHGGETATDGRGRRWIIDPIDGTALFVAGDGRWLVLVALERDGEIVAGVAVTPALGRIWWAERGAGAYEAAIDGPEHRISVARDSADELSESRLGVLPSKIGLAEPLLAVVPDVPWAVHPALLVARGDLDLALQTHGKIWDFAATSLIVQEAGGHYSGLDGRTSPAAGPSLYSRSPGLHAAALAVLGREETKP